MTPCKRLFCTAKEPARGRQPCVSRPVTFCILPFVFLLSVTNPSLAASVGWAATYGGSKSDYASAIQQTDDGGYIVAGGAAFSSEGRDDAWVLKLRYDGTVEWQKTCGGTGSDDVISIQQTDDGYIVAGLTKSFGDEKNAALVLKLGTDGTME